MYDGNERRINMKHPVKTTKEIIDALNKCNCNYAAAGEILGITRERVRVLRISRGIQKISKAYAKNTKVK